MTPLTHPPIFFSVSTLYKAAAKECVTMYSISNNGMHRTQTESLVSQKTIWLINGILANLKKTCQCQFLFGRKILNSNLVKTFQKTIPRFLRTWRTYFCKQHGSPSRRRTAVVWASPVSWVCFGACTHTETI